MANILEYIISMRDRASQVANNVTSNVNNISNATNNATTSANNMQRSMSAAFRATLTSAVNAVRGPDTLRNSVDELRDRLQEVNRVRFGTVLRSEFISTTAEARSLENQIRNLENGISGNGISSRIQGWRQDFASSLPGADLIKNPLALAGAAVGGLFAATKKAMAVEQEKVKLQSLTGSKEIGEALFNGLTDFAVTPGMGSEIYDIGAQMLASGVSSSSIIKDLKNIGDIGMGDSEKIGSLSLAFSQISIKGKLAGEELRQLVTAGFNPLSVISKKTGESMDSLNLRMRKGQIGIDEVRGAMETATGLGGDFHGMMDDLANTPEGKMRKLAGAFDEIANKIGSVFLPIAEKIIDFFNWLNEKMGPYIQPVAAFIGILAGTLLVLAAAQWAVNVAMAANPITWIILAVVALIAAITYLVMKFDEWGAAVLFLLGPIGWLVSAAKLLYDHWESIKEAFSSDGILGGLKRIGIVLLDLVLKPVQQLLEMLAKIPGMAKLAGSGAQKIADLRKSLNLVTPGEGKKKEAKKDELGMPESQYDLTKGGAGAGAAAGKKTNEAIATGGQRNTTINITMDNMVETISVSGRDFKDAANNMADEVQNQLMRVLAMASTTAG